MGKVNEKMKTDDLNMKEGKTSNLEIQLGVFLSIISRNRIVFYNREAKKLDIKGKQIPCLMLISNHPGITQDNIAKVFQIDKGFIARIVKEMEDDELLYRTINPENRRKYNIFLTEEGENIIPKLNIIEEKWKKLVCQGLNKDEILKLTEFLSSLTQNSIDEIKNSN